MELIDYTMSEKTSLIERARINKKKYTFSMDDLYKHAHDWLVWKGYDVTEKKYKEKILPDGRIIEIEWVCTRDIDEYSQFEVEVGWNFYGIKNVEVMKDGDKVKRQNGEIDTFVSARLVLDWRNKWEESAFLTFLKAFYEKYLYVGTIGRLKSEIWKEGWEFFNELKAFVEMYTYEV